MYEALMMEHNESAFEVDEKSKPKPYHQQGHKSQGRMSPQGCHQALLYRLPHREIHHRLAKAPQTYRSNALIPSSLDEYQPWCLNVYRWGSDVITHEDHACCSTQSGYSKGVVDVAKTRWLWLVVQQSLGVYQPHALKISARECSDVPCTGTSSGLSDTYSPSLWPEKLLRTNEDDSVGFYDSANVKLLKTIYHKKWGTNQPASRIQLRPHSIPASYHFVLISHFKWYGIIGPPMHGDAGLQSGNCIGPGNSPICNLGPGPFGHLNKWIRNGLGNYSIWACKPGA
ncbi:hypothetical protein VNO77_02063 [Canavalia gladiata]|uniref:Uncharacterized protein n=1 Tax=Canavalia gladiata TaxID=3824 RepID=A0AAN9MSY1_CANGL